MAPLPSDAQTQGNETQTKKKETVSKTLDLITSISGYIFMYSEAVHATLISLLRFPMQIRLGINCSTNCVRKWDMATKKKESK